MDESDAVDPADAKINELLGQIAATTRDVGRRERILDLMVTLPPIREWPPEALGQLRATYEYTRGLRRDLEARQLDQMFNAADDAAPSRTYDGIPGRPPRIEPPCVQANEGVTE